MVAKVAVSAAVYAIDKPYSYRVLPEQHILPGMRVRLPFGNGNRRVEGIVLTLCSEPEEGLKPIDCALDEEPLLSESMLRLAAFLRERYFCTFYEAIKAILPAGFWFEERDSYTVLSPLPENWSEMIRRKPAAQRLMESVLALGGAAEYKTLKKSFEDEQQLQADLRYLIGKKLLRAKTDFLQRARDKTAEFAELTLPAAEALEYASRKRKTAPMQAAVLELLATIGRGCVKELCYFTGASTATVKRLEKLGYLSLSQQQMLRRREIRPDTPGEPLTLNASQQSVFEGLWHQAQQAEPGVALLYGVTGSGKTAVYISLIRECLKLGKQAILLVPEISLTPQLLSLLTGYFGEQVAVLHSSLRIGERYDEWKRIHQGKASVVVGTRSAVFAPVPDLGLLIVDEEHEHTYKSENAPCYHAREVAIYRGARENALVLLGSATPSVESMYRARKNIYQLYTLPQRFNGKCLPEVVIVDLKQEIRSGNAGSISQELLCRLREQYKQDRQTILFINRRGSSRLSVCVECGFVPQCPRCSVHLTYHSANRRRMCHYCGYSEPVRTVCPVCGGHLKDVGAGTQRVEEELNVLLPDCGVLRMDADAVSAANTHEKLLHRFESERIPILVGTQMVTKGLNFDNVTLVGVLDADSALYVDHFRASETAFSMMTQVIGRAGRGAAAGTAIIQTMTPDNHVIRQAADQDYDSFYADEIELRQLRNCPPFADLLTMTFYGQMEQQVIACACAVRDQVAEILRSEPWRQTPIRLLGPAPASVTKVNNTYRYRLTLNGSNTRQLRQLVAWVMRQFARDKRSKGVNVFADINMYD